MRAETRTHDAALVARALRREPSAAPEIVARYTPLVRRCLGSSLAGADLDDAVQDVFARCFLHLSRLRDPSSLRSFLIGITLRAAAMDRRRRRIRWWERLSETGELPESFSVQHPIELQQVAWRTRELLSRLRPESSRALELRFVDEKELTEVAETMGVSLATAKRHLARASARIRALAQGEPVVAEYVRSTRSRARR
jgi:RNA polymerase sigma-70 factor (ECF subfamily)